MKALACLLGVGLVTVGVSIAPEHLLIAGVLGGAGVLCLLGG